MAIKITNLDAIRGSGVKNPEALRQNWYSGDTPSTRDILGRISEIYDHNKLAGTFYANQFFKLQQDSSSSFYDPYASATNKAVSELASYGVDTSVIDDQFFRNNDYLREYLNYNGSTNTPSAPGKKASVAEKAAYAYYQIWKSEDKTKKAEEQWNSLQNELSYWAKRTDRNYSDDEIIDKVDWSKYGELTSMETNKLMQPNEYNRAIGYSRDAMYGVIWAARNGGGTGNLFSDIAMSARGKGNVWQENPEITAMLNPENIEYRPYSFDTTLDDLACKYDTNVFTDEWLDTHTYLLNGNDQDKNDYNQISAAVQNANSAKDAVYALNEWKKKNRDKWDTPEEAQKALDKILAKRTVKVNGQEYDLSILNKMDQNMWKNGQRPANANILPMGYGVNYSYNDMVQELGDIATANGLRKNDSETANEMMDDLTAAAPEPAAVPEPVKPAQSDEIDAVSGADAVKRKPGDQTGVRTPTDLAPVNYTDSEIEQIRVKDKKISEASGIVDDVATENESTVMKNAGSVAFFGNKDRFSWIRNNAVSNQRFVDGLVSISSKNLISDGLDKAHSVAEYENVERNYETDNARFNELQNKYGPLEYLQKEFKPEITLTLEGADGDPYDVTLTFKDMKTGYQVSDIVNKNYVFGESESGNDPSVYDQAAAIAAEEWKEARKVLYAQKAVHDHGDPQEVEEYKALSARVHNEEEYLSGKKKTNDENVAALRKTTEKMEMLYDSMMKQGLNASKVKESYDLLGRLLNYHDEPQLPRDTRTKLQYVEWLGEMSGEDYDAEKKSEILHSSIDMIDANIRQIQDDLDSIKTNGYKVPDRYVRNMQYKLQGLENQRKGFEYSEILTDTKQEELDAAIEAGKAFEQYLTDNDVLIDDTIHRAFGFENLKQVATEDDEKTYYYLLGKQVLEHGDEYKELLHSANADDVLTKSGELLQAIMKDSSDYLDYMYDDDYGVWTSRTAEANKEEAQAMVDSGFAGGATANITGTLLTGAESISSALYILDRAFSGDRINPDSKFRNITAFKESTREATRKSIDEYYKDNPTMNYIAKLGYEIYCNHGDSTTNAMLMGAIFPAGGIIGEFVGASPLGATAGLTAAANAVENGADTEQAMFILGATFIAETGFEAITYSNIREALGTAETLSAKSLKQFAVDWLTKSGIEEMIGEVSTDIFGKYADEAAVEWFDNPNYQSEHQKLVDSYYAQGYTGEGEAEAKALEEEVKGYLHTALVAYLSSGTEVAMKAAKAASNTVKTGADIVNDYRSYTKARQKLGFGESMFDYMRQDVRDAMASRNQTTQEASAQEAGTAVPSETVEAPAPVTAEERYNSAEQARTAAEEENATARADYDAAYKNERSKRKVLTEAKKELNKAQKSGNQDQIASAQEKVDAAQQEYDAAKAAKEEARIRRNAASDLLASARAESEAASEAYEAEKATPEQKQAAADVVSLGRVEGSSQTAQTEMVASILDDGEGDAAVSDQANAAATFMPTVLGNDSTFVIQQVITGASRMGIDQATVKTALRNAALGNGAATAVAQSEQFQNASPEQKAQMLAETVEQDQSNPDVQQNIAAKVNDFRSGMVINDLAAQGHFDQAQQAQDKADAAAVETAKAETQLQEKQDALDEATKDVEQKAQAVAENPTDDNMKQHADAVTRADNADESRKQYEEHLAKQQEARKQAEAEAKKAKEDAMASARETAEQTRTQQDQERANEAATLAEQQRQQAADQAEAERQQKIADNRSGKTAEESARAKIQRLAEAKGYTGEQAEQFVNDVMNYWQTGQVNKVDMSKQFSKSEGYLMMGALSRRFGINVEITDIPTGENGYYDPSTNTITLNSNLPAGQVLVEFALHELTHSLESTGSYQQYHDTVLNTLFPSEAELNDAIAKKMTDYEEKGHPIDETQAKRELVAEFTRLKLNDKNVVQRMVDAGMGGRIRNALHNVNQFLKNIKLTGEARTEAENLRRTERLFQKAILERARAQQKANETAAQQDNAVTNPTGAAQANNTESRKPFVRASDKVSGETRYVKLPNGSVKSYNQTANSVARDVNKVYKTNVPNSSISSGIQNARNLFIHGDAEGAVNAVFELAKNVEKGIGMSRTSMKPSALAQALNGFFGNNVIPISESDANALASVYGSVAKANRVLAEAGVKARLRLDKNNNNTGLRLDDVFRNDSHVTAEGNGFDVSSALGGVDTARWEDILHELDHQREAYANQVRDEYTNGGAVSAEDLQAEIHAMIWNQVANYSDVTVDENGMIQARGNDEAANTETETDWGIDEDDRAFSAAESELTDAQKAQALQEAGVDYESAVARGDMEAAQEDVEFAAREAGYDTPKLYHGTRAFGFTEFDLGKGENLIFATSDRKVGETYSGETERSRISDASTLDVDNLHGEQLLDEAKKNLPKYKDYRLMSSEEKETARNDARNDISSVWQGFSDFVNENQYSFDEAKMSIVNNMLESLTNVIEAETEEDAEKAWDLFNRYSWEFKWIDESLFEQFWETDQRNEQLYRAKNALFDFMYDGDIYTDSFHDHVFDNQMAIELNANLHKGVYELYGKTGKQLVIDAEGSNWNQITPPEELNLYGPQRTRDIAEAAKALGYDSVLIRNLKDSGGETAYNWPSDVYIFFDANQLKSADTVTYDNNGNPIPLDQRFSDSNDIRYSTGNEQMTDAERNQALIDAGLMTEEEAAAEQAANRINIEGLTDAENEMLSASLPRGDEGNGQRQWGRQGAQQSDELDSRVKEYLLKNNMYTKDTNEEQINRALNWIRNNRSQGDPDGYYASLQQVNSKKFNPLSPDGQAKMVAMMGMAAAKNDLYAQVQLADTYNRQGTLAGQTLQARKLFRLMTPEGRIATLQKMLGDVQTEVENRGGDGSNITFSEWIYRAAAAAETEEEFSQVRDAAAAELGAQLPANWKEKLTGFRMLAMLGNPRTHIRNIAGNALFMPAVGIKNKVGAVLESMFLDEGERTKTLGFATKEARDFAKDYSLEIEDVLRGEAKYNDQDKVRQNVKTWGTGDGIISKTIGKFLQAYSDLNGNALETEDWIFLRRHFRNALAGYMTANKLTAADMTGETLEKAASYAINEAQKATYRDPNSVATALGNIASKGQGTKVQTGAKAIQGVINAVLPFKKTPANILRRGVEYSPVGLVSAVRDVKAMVDTVRYQEGKTSKAPKRTVTPAQFIDKIASGLTGSGVMALGFALAMAGVARGGFDYEDPEDKIAQLEGEQEYGVNFGKLGNMISKAITGAELFGEDVTRTMDWAAPMSMPFFVGVVMNDIFKNANTDDDDETLMKKAQGVLESLLSITEPVFNLSMLDGVNRLFKIDTSNSKAPALDIALNIALNYASSYVPTILGQVARTIDPTRRATYVESGAFLKQFWKTVEQVQNKIPGASSQNIPYMDAFGREQTNTVFSAALENFLAPWYKSELDKDDVTQEIKRVYNETKVGTFIPDTAPKQFKIGKTQYKLTDKEYEAFQKDQGEAWYNTINDLIKTDEYQMADDVTKAGMLDDCRTYAMQSAKYHIDNNFKADKWVTNAMQSGNVTQAIVNNAIERNRKEFITDYSYQLAKALYTGDDETAETLMEGLEQAKVYDSYDVARKAITEYFKPIYQEADEDERDDIEGMLMDLDFGYRSSDIHKWAAGTKNEDEEEEDEDEEAYDNSRWLQNNSSSAQPARFIASNGMSDTGFSDRAPSMPERPASDNGWNQYMNDLDDYWADYDFASNDPVGQYGQGNIDLDNRQTVQNDDGSISTEQSFSFYDEQTGKEVLIPLVADGRVMTQDEAIDRYYETGEYLGMFDDWHDADEYAMMLHNRQDWYYHQ